MLPADLEADWCSFLALLSSLDSPMEWDVFLSQVVLSVMTLTFVDTLDDIDWLEDDASGIEFLFVIALTNAVIEIWNSL